MSQQKLLIFYGLVVTVFVFLFLGLRFKKNRPTPLNLRKTRSSNTKDVDGSEEEELNVYFLFQGCMRDAHEVIGIPAGSSIHEVEKAFKESCRRSPESREILEKAYAAIHEKMTPGNQ